MGCERRSALSRDDVRRRRLQNDRQEGGNVGDRVEADMTRHVFLALSPLHLRNFTAREVLQCTAIEFSVGSSRKIRHTHHMPWELCA